METGQAYTLWPVCSEIAAAPPPRQGRITNIPFWQKVEKLAQRFEKIEVLARGAKRGDSFMVGVRGEIDV